MMKQVMVIQPEQSIFSGQEISFFNDRRRDDGQFNSARLNPVVASARVR